MARSKPSKRPIRLQGERFPWGALGLSLVIVAVGVGWWLQRDNSNSPPITPFQKTEVSILLPDPLVLSDPPALSLIPPPKTSPSNPTPSLPIATLPILVSNLPPKLVPTARVEMKFSARSVTNLVEAQIALARLGISAGSIDGVAGPQSAAAFRAFQMRQGLELTGRLDRATRSALILSSLPFTRFEVTQVLLEGLAPLPKTWLGKSKATHLGFETLLELIAERFQSHPSLIRGLNPGIDWEHPIAGLNLLVPDVTILGARRPSLVRISLSGHHLRAFSSRGDLLVHFPCSIARRVENRPIGDLQVVVVVSDPDYTFDPEMFPESVAARSIDRKLRVAPGPNNPVGSAWIGLDRAGYGIHGTPKPEDVGRTESHGCFRLANWNADLLRRMAWKGLSVRVEP
ncbi:MAG: murein L,D-transpeptidase [Pedosphaera sp.]|nr:murein L,D-transpeptidase [Pedosphaera sp.]